MTDPALHHYQVGALYHPARSSWPERGVYQYRGGQHELVLFFDHPRPEEIAAVAQGMAEFALLTEGSVILFCYRFAPGIPWSDAPYSIHLAPEAERTPPPPLPTPGSRALLHVILVGAHDGLIKALRATALSTAFSHVLHDAIAAQLAQPWDPEYFDRELATLYRRYPTADALAAAGITGGFSTPGAGDGE